MPIQTRVALVTGATQGIGRATAFALAEAGFSGAVLARTEADVRAVARELRSRGGVRGGAALPIVADVTVPEDLQRALETVVAEFSVLDVLVNNAGTGIRKPFVHMTGAECDFLIDLNLRGLLFCTRAALRYMLPRRQGCIVNIASRAAHLPEPDLAVY